MANEFKMSAEKAEKISKVLKDAYEAHTEKGYNAIMQIADYLVTSDQSYLTLYNNTRKNMTELENDEIAQFLLAKFLGLL